MTCNLSRPLQWQLMAFSIVMRQEVQQFFVSFARFKKSVSNVSVVGLVSHIGLFCGIVRRFLVERPENG